MILKTKPVEKSWANSKLFNVYFKEVSFPMCGQRFAWAVVGYKWVRICIPFHNVKFKIQRSLWNVMDVKNYERGK